MGTVGLSRHVVDVLKYLEHLRDNKQVKKLGSLNVPAELSLLFKLHI